MGKFTKTVLCSRTFDVVVGTIIGAALASGLILVSMVLTFLSYGLWTLIETFI